MGYDEVLAQGNGFGPGRWRFEPGMLFGTREIWWVLPDGAQSLRPVVHNGLDMRIYREDTGRERVLGAGSSVLVAEAGVIAGIVRDFMGYSVFVDHGTTGDATIYSAYGHLDPADAVSRGRKVSRGERIGAVSEGRGGKVPPHVHFSVFRIAGHDSPVFLDWGALDGSSEVVFLDPLNDPA